ncbi:mitochondria fission 1 protein [Syncephalis plumigaleata]|nr:mitochondria fission 1 protein [Syncephalis plumigaleata]
MSDQHHLPQINDIELPISKAELEVLRLQYEQEGQSATPQTKFNYAWGLVKSRSRSEQELGVQLLTEICRGSPQRRRESLYYLSLGYCKLGNYVDARQCIDQLLELEPHNQQAKKLRAIIDRNVKREGLIGFTVVGGLVTGIALLAGVLLKRHKK